MMYSFYDNEKKNIIPTEMDFIALEFKNFLLYFVYFPFNKMFLKMYCLFI